MCFSALCHAERRGILVRKQQKMTGRPVTPLHKGTLVCWLAADAQRFFGEGETRHIAHGDQ